MSVRISNISDLFKWYIGTKVLTSFFECRIVTELKKVGTKNYPGRDLQRDPRDLVSKNQFVNMTLK